MENLWILLPARMLWQFGQQDSGNRCYSVVQLIPGFLSNYTMLQRLLYQTSWNNILNANFDHLKLLISNRKDSFSNVLSWNLWFLWQSLWIFWFVGTPLTDRLLSSAVESWLRDSFKNFHFLIILWYKFVIHVPLHITLASNKQHDSQDFELGYFQKHWILNHTRSVLSRECVMSSCASPRDHSGRCLLSLV